MLSSSCGLVLARHQRNETFYVSARALQQKDFAKWGGRCTRRKIRRITAKNQQHGCDYSSVLLLSCSNSVHSRTDVTQTYSNRTSDNQQRTFVLRQVRSCEDTLFCVQPHSAIPLSPRLRYCRWIPSTCALTICQKAICVWVDVALHVNNAADECGYREEIHARKWIGCEINTSQPTVLEQNLHRACD